MAAKKSSTVALQSAVASEPLPEVGEMEPTLRGILNASMLKSEALQVSPAAAPRQSPELVQDHTLRPSGPRL